MSQSSYSRRRRSGFTASSDSEEDDRTLGQLMHRLEADKVCNIFCGCYGVHTLPDDIVEVDLMAVCAGIRRC